MSQEKPNNSQIGSAATLSGDELEQVRELLFGGIIRDIERQREALQKDVSVGFAEADQMTNRRLDDVMRRLDALHREIHNDRAENKVHREREAKKADNALVKLASEQASALAQESMRIDQAIAAEKQRIDEALANEIQRINDAMDALYQQIKTDKLQHANALKAGLASERNRLSQSIKLLADSVDIEKSEA